MVGAKRYLQPVLSTNQRTYMSLIDRISTENIIFIMDLLLNKSPDVDED